MAGCGHNALMAQQPTESELLRERLDGIREEKAELSARLRELQAKEERLAFALGVLEDVLSELNDKSPRVQVGESAADLFAPAPGERQTLEQLILSLFGSWSTITSAEVVSTLALLTDAKRESILSTLSRMVAKGLLKRDGRLYFLGNKGEGSEVTTTTEPSGATTSVRGQATSGLMTDEEGDEEL